MVILIHWRCRGQTELSHQHQHQQDSRHPLRSPDLERMNDDSLRYVFVRSLFRCTTLCPSFPLTDSSPCLLSILAPFVVSLLALAAAGAVDR